MNLGVKEQILENWQGDRANGEGRPGGRKGEGGDSIPAGEITLREKRGKLGSK